MARCRLSAWSLSELLGSQDLTADKVLYTLGPVLTVPAEPAELAVLRGGLTGVSYGVGMA